MDLGSQITKGGGGWGGWGDCKAERQAELTAIWKYESQQICASRLHAGM